MTQPIAPESSQPAQGQVSAQPAPPIMHSPVSHLEDAVDLPAGRSMQPDESMEISCARPTRFIVVAGAADSGKTTLLGSLHERFLRGPFAGYLFAGCATFLGFERICHKGRGESGRSVPDTDRTKRTQGRQLLHLRLRVEDRSSPAQDLLLSDLSGEEFDDARDSGDLARELRIVRAAHHMLLLVDGEKMANLRLRQTARDEACLLLRTLVEEGLLGAKSRVDVLFTKWDIAGAEGVAAVSELFAESIMHDIRTQYGPKLATIRSFRVSARDPHGELPPADGLEAALPAWVELGVESAPMAPPMMVERPDATEYDRFLRRELPALFAKGGQ